MKMWKNVAKMENVAKMWHQGQKCGKCPKNVAIWQPWLYLYADLYFFCIQIQTIFGQFCIFCIFGTEKTDTDVRPSTDTETDTGFLKIPNTNVNVTNALWFLKKNF